MPQFLYVKFDFKTYKVSAQLSRSAGTVLIAKVAFISKKCIRFQAVYGVC